MGIRRIISKARTVSAHGKPQYPCPACGFIGFAQPPGSYDICAICGWEDDNVQLLHPMMKGGANKKCLHEVRRKILTTYPVDIKEASGLQRDPAWRPLSPKELQASPDILQTGLDYFHAAGDSFRGYYWKR
ncbi:MAG TPA: CPCC family cysteine-rich protein [Gammaproteobacteria bacterium]